MTTYLLCGGGTAGHVNPLLAIADRITRDEPDASAVVLGTVEGLEARLVPARGYELVTVEKIPFPRRPGRGSLAFPSRLGGVVRSIRTLIAERGVDVVVGVGGYVAAPAYIAARRSRVPIALHEANARPGMANRLGSTFTRHVGVAFAGTPLRHARHVGMPLRAEIETLDRAAVRDEAIGALGLDPAARTLLVTGGSLGARRLNETIRAALPALLATGWQVLHITGERDDPVGTAKGDGYHPIAYCDRMDLALAAADLAVSRAGSATVSELTALGIPAVYVPLAIGNGEQRLNASGAVIGGAARMVSNDEFTPGWAGSQLPELMRDRDTLAQMSDAASRLGVRDGTARMMALIHEAAGIRLTR